MSEARGHDSPHARACRTVARLVFIGGLAWGIWAADWRPIAWGTGLAFGALPRDPKAPP